MIKKYGLKGTIGIITFIFMILGETNTEEYPNYIYEHNWVTLTIIGIIVFWLIFYPNEKDD